MGRGIRDDITAAFEKHKLEDSFDDDTPTGEHDHDDDQDSAAAAPATDAHVDTDTPDGDKTAKTDDEPADKPDGGEPTDAAASDKPAGRKDKAIGPKDSLKAPLDWSPKDREDWSRIPRHLQERILAREKHIAETVSGTKDARKIASRIDGMRQTYGAIMAAEGVNDPMQAIDGMFKTVASLRMGTPVAKARVIADMINHYGVDVTALDDVLVGQEPKSAGDPQMAAVQKMLDERLGPVNQLMQGLTNYQKAAQQGQQTQAQQQVQQFAEKAEFLNDVREDMADLIDLAAKRGQTMTLQQAYDTACQIHPEISKIVAGRRVTGGQADIDRKRAAASSVNGRRGGALQQQEGDGSLRSTIAAAWDATDRA